MEAFEYAKATSVRAAIELLGSNWKQASVFAGGTDLLDLLKDDIESTKRLVNIKTIAALRRMEPSAAGLQIGAAVTFEELLEHRPIEETLPALAQAAAGVTSPQIRNMGTVAGDLCQRPRCWFYRNGFGLLALDKNGESLVAKGDNRYHAIFGNSGPAKFVSPSRLAPALIAYGAKVRIEGANGAREIPVENFFTVPEKQGEREHALTPREILTEIVVPPSAHEMRGATYEVQQKEGLDWPLAAAAVALRMRGETVESARIVLGHVAPRPWPAEAAEKWLEGKSINEANAAKAGQAATEGATPLSRNGYKVQLVRVCVKRALLAAAHGRAAAAKGGA